MDGCSICYVFFFNDTATTEIYTLSLHDALPIWAWVCYSWLTNNAVRPEEATPARLVVLSAMAAMLVASLAVPDAFGGAGILFGGAYFVVRLPHPPLYPFTTGRPPGGGRGVHRD